MGGQMYIAAGLIGAAIVGWLMWSFFSSLGEWRSGRQVTMVAKRVTKEFVKHHYFDASISRWVRNSDGAALYEHGYGPPNPERQKGSSLLLTEHSTGRRIDEVN